MQEDCPVVGLYSVVFGSGAVLMALEVLGSRVMAPHFGSSVYVWGSLISVIMAALSLGYYLGGMLADARPRYSTLAFTLLAAGALTALIPVYGEQIAGALSGWGPRAGTLTAAMAIFFPPTVLMGMVSPLGMRMGVSSMQQLGQSAGRLNAVSTGGSIAGTLVTTFFLIPLAGTKQLIATLAAALIVLAAIPFFMERKRSWGAAAAVGGLLLALWGPTGVLGSVEMSPVGPLRTIYAEESAYHNIRVMDGSGGRYLRFDKSWQTGMNLDDPYTSPLPYPDYFHLAMAQNPDIREVLVVGLGGGAAPKRFWHDYPAVKVDVVELDPAVIDVARRYFAVPEDDRLKLHVGDGRRFLETSTKRYDLIIVDAYYSDSIPFHLTTREFMQAVKQHLRPNGVVALNLIGSIEGEHSQFFRAMYKTTAESFPTRYIVPVDWDRNPSTTEPRNIILFASDAPQLDKPAFTRAVQNVRSTLPLGAMASGLYTGAIKTDDVAVLTDDHAPVDNMIKVMD